MRGTWAILAAVGLAAMLQAAPVAMADVFNLGSMFNPATGQWTVMTSLETVPVGDPDNVADTAAHSGNPNGQGSVAYEYNIGKYEVTVGQYCEFLNAVAATDNYNLYNYNMYGGPQSTGIRRDGRPGSYSYTATNVYTVNEPMNYVSFWDACRFANWLSNGQGSGDTEMGSYTLNGYNGYDGRTIQRNSGATWVVTSEDEWYKAAYYQGGSNNAGYWDYPISGNSITTAQANYYETSAGSVYRPVDVGSYAYPSPYGTFDQAGNLAEWNEAIVYQDTTHAARGMRGGSFIYYMDLTDLLSSGRHRSSYPSNDFDTVGFRVALVPEPTSLAILSLGAAGLMRRRKGRG